MSNDHSESSAAANSFLEQALLELPSEVLALVRPHIVPLRVDFKENPYYAPHRIRAWLIGCVAQSEVWLSFEPLNTGEFWCVLRSGDLSVGNDANWFRKLDDAFAAAGVPIVFPPGHEVA